MENNINKFNFFGSIWTSFFVLSLICLVPAFFYLFVIDSLSILSVLVLGAIMQIYSYTAILFFVLILILRKLLKSKTGGLWIAVLLGIGYIGWLFLYFPNFRVAVALRTDKINTCLGNAKCILEFVDTTKEKDDKACSEMNEHSGANEKIACYLLLANNSGDERFCDKITDFSSEDADLCHLGIIGLNKEFVLREKWLTYGDSYFYENKSVFIGMRPDYSMPKDMIKSGKAVVLDLPIKVVLLELDSRSYMSVIYPKYDTRFGGARVKIVDGKYAGSEGWLDFEAISKNRNEL